MDVPCILGRSCREVVPLLPVLLLLFTVPATSRPHISSTHQTDSHATSSRAPVVRASAVSTGPDSLPTRIQQAQYRCSNSQGTCVSKAAQLGSPVVPTVSPEEWQDRCSCSDLQWLRWVPPSLLRKPRQPCTLETTGDALDFHHSLNRADQIRAYVTPAKVMHQSRVNQHHKGSHGQSFPMCCRDYIRCSADQRRALASDPTAAARLKFLVWRAVPDAGAWGRVGDGR
jgi:hypothetical protein